MQQEAARRVRQMQEHSRRVFEQHERRTPESLAAARPPERHPPAGSPPAPCPPAGPSADLPAKTLEDMEQWLLLGLALLLFRNGCRPELIVALLYLAM